MKALLSLVVAGLFACSAYAQTKTETKVAKPSANSPKESFAKTMSLKQSAAFLDQSSLWWTESRKCGTCHTNYIFMMARPALGEKSEALDQVRGFFEKRAAEWDTNKPRWDAEVVMTGSMLAINDSLTTKKLHPLSRQALDRMWTLQQADGSWKWIKCNWPPMEHDDYYGALVAALGTGLAPDQYAQTPKAKEGLEKLRGYFAKNPVPDLHHRSLLMWASLQIEGLMTEVQRKETVANLLDKQNPDGGWSLAGLGKWKRHDKSDNDPKVSDGYGTGFTLFILRQAGISAEQEKMKAGVEWLRKNQRESGRWFTRSLSTDSNNFLTHTGTAYAVMALRACGETVK